VGLARWMVCFVMFHSFFCCASPLPSLPFRRSRVKPERRSLISACRCSSLLPRAAALPLLLLWKKRRRQVDCFLLTCSNLSCAEAMSRGDGPYRATTGYAVEGWARSGTLTQFRGLGRQLYETKFPRVIRRSVGKQSSASVRQNEPAICNAELTAGFEGSVLPIM
jgi:hypothetical protein